MGTKTGISWTEATWNPIRGCSRVSDGCRLCYAELVAARFSGPGQPYEGLAKWLEKPDGTRVPRWTGKVMVVEKHMDDPLRWKKPRMIFTNSMSDIFHENLATADIDRIVARMGLARQHTFQPLTKRAERLADYLEDGALTGRLMDEAKRAAPSVLWNGNLMQMGLELESRGILPNVWWGVSAEDQKTADVRIPFLVSAPAARRWVSYEPALGPIDFSPWLAPDEFDLPGLDWIVVGGESEQHPQEPHEFKVEWGLAVQKQCAIAGVPFFFKQLGSLPTLNGSPVLISDRMGKTESDWPPEFRGAQAYPEPADASA